MQCKRLFASKGAHNSFCFCLYLLGASRTGASPRLANSAKYSGCMVWRTGMCAVLSPTTIPPFAATNAAKQTGTAARLQRSAASCQRRRQACASVTCTSPSSVAGVRAPGTELCCVAAAATDAVASGRVARYVLGLRPQVVSQQRSNTLTCKVQWIPLCHVAAGLQAAEVLRHEQLTYTALRLKNAFRLTTSS